jgi:hypothetical protein
VVAVVALVAGAAATGGAVLQRAQSSFVTPLGEGLFGMTLGAVGPSGDARWPAAVLPSLTMPWNRVRGVLLVMPVIVFGLPGLARLVWEGKRAEASVIGGALALLLLLYAQYWRWCGPDGVPLASPFLNEAMPAWSIATVAWSGHAGRSGRSWFVIAACWSAANQALVVFGTYGAMLAGPDGMGPEVWRIGALLIITALFAWIGEGVWRSYAAGRSGALPA